MAVSSATLFVASPEPLVALVRLAAAGATITTPEPAGPGLPEHAPSLYAIHAPTGTGSATRIFLLLGTAMRESLLASAGRSAPRETGPQ